MGFSHHPLALLLNPNTLLPGIPAAPGNLSPYVILFRPQTPCHAACLGPVGRPLLPTLQHHEQRSRSLFLGAEDSGGARLAVAAAPRKPPGGGSGAWMVTRPGWPVGRGTPFLAFLLTVRDLAEWPAERGGSGGPLE